MLFIRSDAPEYVQKKYPEVVFIPRLERNYTALFAASDCFVLASHGEGWGRPAVESMSFGKPTIVTNWSGFQEYATEENAFLVPVTLELVPAGAMEGAPADARWAKVSKSKLKQTMRFVYENRLLAAERGRKARDHIARFFDEDVVGERVRELFKENCLRSRNATL